MAGHLDRSSPLLLTEGRQHNARSWCVTNTAIISEIKGPPKHWRDDWFWMNPIICVNTRKRFMPPRTGLLQTAVCFCQLRLTVPVTHWRSLHLKSRNITDHCMLICAGGSLLQWSVHQSSPGRYINNPRQASGKGTFLGSCELSLIELCTEFHEHPKFTLVAQ